MIRISRGNSKKRPIFLVIFIASIIGAFNLILLIDPGLFQFFEIGFFISHVFQILTILGFSTGIIIIIVFFTYSAVLSILSIIDLNYFKPIKNYKLGMIFMAINFLATLLIFIMIIITTILTTNWWLLPAIFTGVPCACSLINLVLFHNIINFLKKNH